MPAVMPAPIPGRTLAPTPGPIRALTPAPIRAPTLGQILAPTLALFNQTSGRVSLERLSANRQPFSIPTRFFAPRNRRLRGIPTLPNSVAFHKLAPYLPFPT